MRFTLTALMFVLVSTLSPAHAADVLGEIPNPRSDELYKAPKTLPASWKLRLAPLVASQGLDIASSYGMRELNPVLAGSRGEFGVKATLVKVGVTAAFIGVEYAIVKAHPGAARVLSKMNWSGAALTTGFAAHNFSIR